MDMILAIRGTVDDDTEAHNILAAVEAALVPFAELNLKTSCEIKQPIETPP